MELGAEFVVNIILHTKTGGMHGCREKRHLSAPASTSNRSVLPAGTRSLTKYNTAEMKSTTYAGFNTKTEGADVVAAFPGAVKGKTVLITGVSKAGIGYSVAEALVRPSILPK